LVFKNAVMYLKNRPTRIRSISIKVTKKEKIILRLHLRDIIHTSPQQGHYRSLQGQKPEKDKEREGYKVETR